MIKAYRHALATFAVAMLPSIVEAKPSKGISFSGEYEFLDLVSVYDAPSSATQGRSLFVCHRINKHHMYFMPTRYESRGYVLAENRCRTSKYILLTPDQFTQAQKAGYIPQRVPPVPTIDPIRRIGTYWWTLSLLLPLVAWAKAKRKARARRSELDRHPLFTQRMIEVACNAAVCDGPLRDAEITMIRAAIEQVASVPLDETEIRRVAETLEVDPSRISFSKFGNDLTQSQKDLLLELAVDVVKADRFIRPPEIEFLNRLARGFGIPQARLAQLTGELK